MNPLVSINIVTHNRAHYLGAAIKSVLAQSYDNWELIIIDDASTDSTSELMKRYLVDERIRYFLVEKQEKISKVRNIALHESVGDYIAVLDSDDLWIDSDKLKKQVDFLENNLDYALIGGGSQVIDEKNEVMEVIIKPLSDEAIRKDFFTKNPFFHSSVLVRANILKNIGGYDEKLSYGEDMDMCLRVGRDYKLQNLPEAVLAYRRHDGNEAVKHSKKAVLDVFRIIAKNRKAYRASILVYLKKVIVKAREIL